MTARVVLRAARARPFYGRHPWVFAGAIDSVQSDPADGDEVELYSHAGHFIARGLYNSKSKIRVRLYSWDADNPLDESFFRSRLQEAIRLREEILDFKGPGQACRLVFSEADGFSGLTVDRYDRWLVMQFTSLGLGMRRDMLADVLNELAQPEGILVRTEKGIGKLEGLELTDGPLRGALPSSPVVIEEHGVRFQVNLLEGQKTGFYLDQRDNRRAVAAYAHRRRVLDAFCYTGGFGLHCARAGAKEITGLDGSAPALELAAANARLNNVNNISFRAGDVFAQLDSLVEARERFDLVILDPPKFARAQHAVPDAMRGYRQLQTQALRLLDADGILVVCCCSGLITREMLEGLFSQLAAETKRRIQILEVRGQAPDHPVAATCPESSYLKCLICRVI